MFYSDIEAFAECEINGVDGYWELLFDCDYYAGRPAKLSGAFEDSYPEEPEEFEFSNVRILMADNSYSELDDKTVKFLDEILVDAMRSELERYRDE